MTYTANTSHCLSTKILLYGPAEGSYRPNRCSNRNRWFDEFSHEVALNCHYLIKGPENIVPRFYGAFGSLEEDLRAVVLEH